MNLSEQELQEFKEVFNLVDIDQGGSISADELSRLMDTLGIKTTAEELAAMIAEIDTDGNGDIEFDEFVMVMSRRISADYTAADVKRSFRMFSDTKAPPGHIAVADLVHALMTYGKERMSKEDAKALVAQMDLVEGKFVNYSEFVNMMMPS